MEGWIKVERAIVEHWVFQDAEYFRAWMLLLIMANHKDAKILVSGKPTVIKRGSFLTSTYKLAERLGWDRRKVMRFIRRLESDGMLLINGTTDGTTNGTTNGTTLTIVNYEKYQGHGTTNGTTNGTTDGTTDGTQTRITKNDKEGKEARARARSSMEGWTVKKTGFHNFEERHIDYDALFDELRQKTGKAVI